MSIRQPKEAGDGKRHDNRNHAGSVSHERRLRGSENDLREWLKTAGLNVAAAISGILRIVRK